MDWFKMKDRMRDGRIFAGFSCCYDCHVPQAICSKWAEENGRWRCLPDGACQFDQIIMPVVISGINEGIDETCPYDPGSNTKGWSQDWRLGRRGDHS